jgi:DNA-binding CsgD family transcriptional regulator
MKRRESVVYGRVEMLAIEACVHYQLKNRDMAFAALRDAYDDALPNGLIIPFLGLGKYMRTLASAAGRGGTGIPSGWLDNVNRLSSTFAKRQAQMIAQNNQANGINTSFGISEREKAVLADLSHGLSRSEIAASRKISINTVKAIIEILQTKLDAVNTADLVRAAMENRLI